MRVIFVDDFLRYNINLMDIYATESLIHMKF